MLKSCVKQTDIKDSNWHARIQQFKVVVEKISSTGVSIIQLTDEKIFSVSMSSNPQNNCLYAPATTKKTCGHKVI